jgi:Transposase
MALYVGLDVSLRTISVCIVESKGKVVWEGKVLCEGPALIAALAPYRKKIKRVGIEAGPLSEWLFGILTECHFNAVCIEARHAHRFLSSRPNKTDRNDARGIADMMRLGHFKAVHVKSRASQLLRTMLAARKTFVDHMLEIEQAIRGFLKVYGLKLGAVHRYNFSAKVKALVADTPELAAANRAAARGARHDAQEEEGDRPRAGEAGAPGHGLPAPYDHPRCRTDHQPGLQGNDRRSGEIQIIAGGAGTSRPDAPHLPVRRDGPIGSHQQVRRPPAAALPLRSGQCAPARDQEVVGAAGVGREARQAGGEQEGLRGRCAQARHHHASHVARGHRLPIRHGTAAPGKGVSS